MNKPTLPQIMAVMLLLLQFANFAFAQKSPHETPPDPSASGVVLEWEYTTHPYAYVQEGEKVVFEFPFTNKGTEPFIINNMRSSCGCLCPYWPKEPIQPGETAVVKGLYNSGGRPGKFSKSLTVTGNTDPARQVLYIKGEAEKKPEDPLAAKRAQLLEENPICPAGREPKTEQALKRNPYAKME